MGAVGTSRHEQDQACWDCRVIRTLLATLQGLTLWSEVFSVVHMLCCLGNRIVYSLHLAICLSEGGSYLRSTFLVLLSYRLMIFLQPTRALLTKISQHLTIFFFFVILVASVVKVSAKQ